MFILRVRVLSAFLTLAYMLNMIFVIVSILRCASLWGPVCSFDCLAEKGRTKGAWESWNFRRIRKA